MNETELKALLSRIRPADSAAKAAAKERQSKLAKPPGSLGALEEISVRLAGITGRVCNRIEKTRIVVFAADNGIVAEGVASTPAVRDACAGNKYDSRQNRHVRNRAGLRH